MIVVAGLTPAFQQIQIHGALRPGEVNRAREVRWCASGKVLNVAIALARLGRPLLTIAPLGGLAGRMIENEFEENDIAARWVFARVPTRVCTTIIETELSRTTELVENAHPLTEQELHMFSEAFVPSVYGASFIVFSGSLPAGAPASYFVDLIDRGEVAGDQLILDIRGTELLATLPKRPLLVKPNREELEMTVGKKLADEAAVLEAMRGLNAQGAQWVVVSDGAKATYLTSAKETYRFKPCPVEKVENPIGCGDVLAAGIAWGLRDKQPVVDAVRLGMGAAADNLSELLPARIDTKRSQENAANVVVEKL
jgi:tagatose 6-phosphate kinase